MKQQQSPVRDRIWRAIQKQKNIFTARILFKQLNTVDKVTLYRALDYFKQHDLVDCIQHDGDEQWYEVHLHDKKHHHHLQCAACQKIVCVPCTTSTPRVKGFSHVHHTAWFAGTCNSCAI